MFTLSAPIALGAVFAMSPLAMAVAATVTSAPVTSATVASNSVTSSGNIGMTASAFTANQYNGSVTLSAQRTGGTTGAVSVTYVTVPESASAGVQYTSQTGTLSWAAGDASNKTFTVPLATHPAFTGTLSFAVRLTAGSGTSLGAHTSALVNIVGGTTPPPPPPVTKSIKQWVSCSETIDESAQLASALQAAANNAFTLIIDCPVRLHTGTAALSSIVVPDGVTVQFVGAGEFLAVSNGPPALTVADPSQVTFIDWNYTYL